MRFLKRLAIIESGAGIGGAEVNLFRLAPRISEAGWELLVLVPTEGPLTNELSRWNIRWRLFESPAFKSTSSYIRQIKVPNPLAISYDCLAIFRQASAITEALRDEGVGLVHTNSMFSHFVGGLAARRLGIPCLWHLQDIVNVRSGFGLFRPLLNLAAGTLASAIVCISESVACQLSWLSIKDRVRLIYNGVDTNLFTNDGPRSYRREWLGTRYTTLVGQVGRLTPWKGQETMIEMAKLAKRENLPIRFVIIGDDSYGLPGYLDHLMRLAQNHDLEDQVLFTRWLNDMPSAYRSLDLLVHPVREPEPFGLAIAEAMACRTPVAVFDYGGAAEVIGSSDHGLLINRHDLDALWQAVKWVHNNPEAASAIGSRARRRVLAKFSLDRCSDQMLELYESLSWQLA